MDSHVTLDGSAPGWLGADQANLPSRATPTTRAPLTPVRHHSGMTVKEETVWHVVQSLCTGGEHDDLPCEGGEWRDEMSLPWFSEGRQAEALAIFREDPKGRSLQYRMIRRTEMVLDL